MFPTIPTNMNTIRREPRIMSAVSCAAPGGVFFTVLVVMFFIVSLAVPRIRECECFNI